MTRKTPAALGAAPAGYAGIHGGIVDLLDATRQMAARNVNALMTASYWEIGRRIVEAEQLGALLDDGDFDYAVQAAALGDASREDWIYERLELAIKQGMADAG